MNTEYKGADGIEIKAYGQGYVYSNRDIEVYF
jgi:hypothetical protein